MFTERSLLGAFVKLRKANSSLVMSVLPSAWNKSAPTGRIFIKFDIGVCFEYLSRKFKLGLPRNLTRKAGNLFENL